MKGKGDGGNVYRGRKRGGEGRGVVRAEPVRARDTPTQSHDVTPDPPDPPSRAAPRLIIPVRTCTPAGGAPGTPPPRPKTRR